MATEVPPTSATISEARVMPTKPNQSRFSAQSLMTAGYYLHSSNLLTQLIFFQQDTNV